MNKITHIDEEKVTTDSQEVTDVMPSKKGRFFRFTKKAVIFTILAIIVIILVVSLGRSLIFNADSVIAVGDLLDAAKPSLFFTRMFFYVLGIFLLPIPFFRNPKIKDKKKAKEMEITFRWVFFWLFFVGEVFAVQNIVGILLR